MNDQAEAAKPAPRKRRPLRWVFRLALVLILGLAVLVAFAPGILSGGWGKGRIVAAINAELTGTASVDTLELSWFNPPVIAGLKVHDSAGRTVASIDRVEVQATLWQLVKGQRDLGTITIDAPTLNVVVEESGKTNLQQLLKTRPQTAGADPGGRDVSQESDEALPVTFKLLVNRLNVVASGPDFDKVTIDGNASLDATAADKPLTFVLDATSRQGDLEGKVAAEATVDPATGALRGTVSVVDLPVVGLDSLLAQHGLLVAGAGEYLSIAGHIQPADDDPGAQDVRALVWATPQPLRDGEAVTARLEALRGGADAGDLPQNLLAFLDGRLSSGMQTATCRRGLVRMRATPPLIEKLIGAPNQPTGRLADDVGVTLELESLRMPLAEFDASQVALKTDITIDPGRYVGDPQLGDVGWTQLTGSIETDNLTDLATVKLDGQLLHADGEQSPLDVDLTLRDMIDERGDPRYDAMRVDGRVELKRVPSALVDKLAETGEAIALGFGPTLDLVVEPNASGQDTLAATVTLGGDYGRADVVLAMDERIRLTQPATVRLDRPAAVLRYYVPDMGGYGVSIDQPVTLTIEKLDMPRPAEGEPFLEPAKTLLLAKVDASGVRVTDPPNTDAPLGPLDIATLTIDLKAEKLDKPRVTVTADVAAGGEGMVGRYASTRLSLTIDAQTTLDSQFNTGPVAMTLTANNAAEQPQPLRSVSLEAQVPADFSRIALTEKAEVKYVADPAVIDAPPGGPTLAWATPVTVRIHEFEAPLAEFAVNRVKTRLDAEIDQAALAGDPRYESASLYDLSVNVDFDGPGNTVKLDGDAGTRFLVDNVTKTGSVNIDATIGKLLDDAGRMRSLDQLKIEDTAVTLRDLPAAWIDVVAPSAYKATTIAGEMLNLTLEAELDAGDGSFDLVAKAPRANAEIHATITDGWMTLNEDAGAAFMVTEELTSELIDHPMLKQAVRSEQPVTVSVASKGFGVPLMKLLSDDPNEVGAALTGASIPRITIDPGKLIVRNAGLIKTLIDLPNRVGKVAELRLGVLGARRGDDTLSAWFTPVDLSIEDGVARYSRMDILIGDHYHVATWGRLNFNDRPVQVDGVRLRGEHGRMVLGITDRALRRVYNISRYGDDPNYMDQFVMSGPIDAIGPDTEEMVARLGLLTGLGAAGQIAGDEIANKGMQILEQIGAARDAIDKVIGQDKAVEKRQFETPPPPRKPFPWPEEVKPKPEPADKPERDAPPQPADDPPRQKKPDKSLEERLIEEGLRQIFK